VQRVVVDASGNVGIGTASPFTFGTYKSLDIRGAGGGWLNMGTTGTSSFYLFTDGTNSGVVAQTNGYLGFSTNNTERMRIDASGNLLVGKTSTGSVGGLDFIPNVSGLGFGRIFLNSGYGAAANSVVFAYNNTTVGFIQQTTTATIYNTSSDYRLKEDIKPMENALSKVSALKPCTYKWKVDGSEGEGFVAHELAEVCPLAVSGEKDAVNEDGSIKSQGIDPSKLVGLLTAAIQELKTELDEAKAKIAALEAK
jgi:hypothetical protein